MRAHLSVPVSGQSQVGEARRAAVRMADETGLSQTDSGTVGVVVTELATNLSKYASGGRILLQVLRRPSGPCVEALAIDAGPGMDVERCLRDGFSTGGSPGTGLGAVRRMATEFDVYSRPGAGTVVLARVGAKCGATVQRGFQWAAVSAPAPHELVCGDAWSVLEREGEIALMMADGLGHGALAAAAADRAAELFEADAFDAPATFCERANRALSGSRGAALAAAHVTQSALVRYAGVGNIAGSLVTASQSRGMFSQNGTVGLHMRKAQQLDYPWPDRALLIMHSDGVSNRWSLDAYEGLIGHHPAVVAAVLLRDFGRGRDDATVVVVRSDRRGTGGVDE